MKKFIIWHSVVTILLAIIALSVDTLEGYRRFIFIIFLFITTGVVKYFLEKKQVPKK